MKKVILLWIAVLFAAGMLIGCHAPGIETVPVTTESTAVATGTTSETTNADDYEGDASSYYIDVVYAQQIGRYGNALSERWSIDQYLENNMSALPYYYYEGNLLENVGFGFADLDQDGSWELVIGAILNAEQDPAVFEIWTLVDGVPVMLAQGNAGNRYVLEYAADDDKWYIVNEASNHAANFATYYLVLKEGKLEVAQGIVFDLFANEENPWFLTKDQDWDTANDTPIDEETATKLQDFNRRFYTALEYFPYAYHPSGQIQPPPNTTREQLLERAAALSQRFGVDIRIPEQSELTYSHYDAYVLDELPIIRASLDMLEENLALYPEGFFRQLTYGSVEVLRIELVGGLAVKAGVDIDPNSVNAFAQEKGSYHLIVLNGYFADLQTLFHEIAHVIDGKLKWDAQHRVNALYSESAWLALQPEGFYYAMSYTVIPEELHGFVESDYFMDLYAMTFPTEDRATLMESAMQNRSQDFEPGMGRREKLQYYAACIRDCFDTTGWPEITLWEQVLQ